MLASSLLGVLIVSLCDMILAYVEAEISTLLLPVAGSWNTNSDIVKVYSLHFL